MFSAGDAVTAVLDKIIEALGNYLRSCESSESCRVRVLLVALVS